MTVEQMIDGLEHAAALIEACWDTWTSEQREQARQSFNAMRAICELVVESQHCTRH